MTIEKFCGLSGIHGADKMALQKQHKGVEMEYSDFYKIISKEYKVPKNMNEFFKNNEKSNKNNVINKTE